MLEQLTQEEIDKLSEIICEKILLRLPETIGNLMSSLTWMMQINKKFYEKNPELLSHKEIVTQVMEEIEALKMGQTYEEIVNKSLPIIKERVRLKSKMSLTPPTPPNLDRRYGEI